MRNNNSPTFPTPAALQMANRYSGVINFSIRYEGRDLPTEDVLKSVKSIYNIWSSDSGITVVVAAGAFGVDSCTRTPGAAPGVIVVGAIDQNDGRSVWSSTTVVGLWVSKSIILRLMCPDCVDIWAPSTNILSICAFGLNAGTSIYSGTSQATPHVTGIVAGLQTRLGPFQPINFPDLSVRTRVIS